MTLAVLVPLNIVFVLLNTGLLLFNGGQLRKLRAMRQCAVVGQESPDWDAITVYVTTVAIKAFQRGYATGWEDATGRAQVDYARRVAASDAYVRTGFEAETVRQHFPRGK